MMDTMELVTVVATNAAIIGSMWGNLSGQHKALRAAYERDREESREAMANIKRFLGMENGTTVLMRRTECTLVEGAVADDLREIRAELHDLRKRLG